MKIIAHRGASGELPEHTLAAFELAAARGADGFECDIRLTRDGQVVCMHDRTTDRVAGRPGVVSALTLAQLRELNVGTPEEPQRVLPLAELLDFFQDVRHSGDYRPEIFIETKHPNRYGPRVEYALQQHLRRWHLDTSRDVHLISFNPQSLVRFRSINPAIHRILLRREHQRVLNPTLEAMQVVDAHGLSIARARLRPGIIGRYGDGTYMWTVDEEDDVRWAARKGVTWLATNFPGRAKLWRDAEGIGPEGSHPVVGAGMDTRVAEGRPARRLTGLLRA